MPCARDRRLSLRAPNRLILIALLAALLAGAAGGAAHAHRTNVTTAEVAVDGTTVAYRLKASPHDLAVALGIETDLVAPVPQDAFEARRDALERYVLTRLRVAGNDQPCAAPSLAVDYAPLPDDLVIAATFRCAEPVERLRIGYFLFFEIDADHRSLGQLVTAAGAEPFLFDRTLFEVEFDIAQPAAQLSFAERFGRIFAIGVEHILAGYDHVLFLLALLIVNARLASLVKIVTAFTIAHSTTLALAWYGILDLPARLVEAAIAFSIAYVAVENILGRGQDRRWLVAGGFGLVHGLGFFNVLSDLGLDREHVVTTLLAFNLGVEAGQLLIVALAYGPLVWWLRQPWYPRTARAGSGAILAVAGWWTVQRVLLI